MHDESPKLLVLFDGVCNLCHAGVRFILKRDPHAKFQFAALQSPRAREYLERFSINAGSLATMVLLEGDRLFTESTAALRIARRLKWPWPLLYAAIAVPRCLRDRCYRWIARNRYRWFGKREQCGLPSTQFQNRFLE